MAPGEWVYTTALNSLIYATGLLRAFHTETEGSVTNRTKQ